MKLIQDEVADILSLPTRDAKKLLLEKLWTLALANNDEAFYKLLVQFYGSFNADQVLDMNAIAQQMYGDEHE